MSSLLPRRFKPGAAVTKASLRATPPPEQIPASPNGGLTAERTSYASSLPVPTSDVPLCSSFSSSHLTLGAGVAIFHLASARVVLCYHSKEHYYFLPKGRKDMNEVLTRGAEREGYEESGYRNRLLPLPIPHRQPRPHQPENERPDQFVTEAVWVQLAPVTRSTQYILFWYVAETVPPALEEELSAKERESGGLYQAPKAFESDMTIQNRIEKEGKGYEPVRHDDTGVNEDEKLYLSLLVSVEEAVRSLGPSSISADVVTKGWDAIQRRIQMESSSVETNEDPN